MNVATEEFDSIPTAVFEIPDHRQYNAPICRKRPKYIDPRRLEKRRRRIESMQRARSRMDNSPTLEMEIEPLHGCHAIAPSSILALGIIGLMAIVVIAIS